MSLFRTIFVLALLCAVLPGCAADKLYQSAMPPFVVHYPASWQTTPGTSDLGAITIFSPDRKISPDSPRVTLHVAAAGNQPVPRSRNDPRPLDLSFQKDLGLQNNGQRGRCYFVTKFPTAWVVEAYAAPKEFDTIRAVAERMVKDLNPNMQIAAQP